MIVPTAQRAVLSFRSVYCVQREKKRMKNEQHKPRWQRFDITSMSARRLYRNGVKPLNAKQWKVGEQTDEQITTDTAMHHLLIDLRQYVKCDPPTASIRPHLIYRSSRGVESIYNLRPSKAYWLQQPPKNILLVYSFYETTVMAIEVTMLRRWKSQNLISKSYIPHHESRRLKKLIFGVHMNIAGSSPRQIITQIDHWRVNANTTRHRYQRLMNYLFGRFSSRQFQSPCVRKRAMDLSYKFLADRTEYRREWNFHLRKNRKRTLDMMNHRNSRKNSFGNRICGQSHCFCHVVGRSMRQSFFLLLFLFEIFSRVFCVCV